MPIVSIDRDDKALTLRVLAEYPVTVRRLWQAFSDPRQLEKFWGPVEWPATFYRHDMSVGGRSNYTMTGPNGEKSSGYWHFLALDAPNSFEVEDGFADEMGNPDSSMPRIRIVYQFSAFDGGARLVATSYFGSLEELEKLAQMGMVEGMKSAMSQIDLVVEDLRTFAADIPVLAQKLDDTRIRVTRVIKGSVEDVWRAHQEPELVKKWLLGPDGWTMPVCQIGQKVGEKNRQEWEKEDGSERFGFEGELLEIDAPYHSLTTEKMIGTDGPTAINRLTLIPVDGATLLSLVITYPDKETRDYVLGTGMTEGMETSYQRLENLVLGA